MKIDKITIPPSPCGHLVLRVEVNGKTHDIHVHRDDLTLDGPEEMRDAVIARVRSFARENGIGTINALRTALQGKVFHV